MNVEVNGVCAYGGIGYAKLKLGVCMDVSVSVTIDEGIPMFSKGRARVDRSSFRCSTAVEARCSDCISKANAPSMLQV